jgi:protoporphyrinogen oxidase
LCRSKRIGDFTFDCDGHVLHFRHGYTLNLVKRLLGSNLVQHSRSAWIYAHGRYIRYPFQANLHGLPSSVAQECLLEYIRRDSRLKSTDALTFAAWIDQTFGKGIARHFMRPYNEKFWTVAPEELTCEWLHGFVPVPSLSDVIEGTIKESQRQFGYNAKFWYPRRGGICQLPLALARQIKHIRENKEIKKINLTKKEVLTADGRRERYDCLISTIPMPGLPKIIEDIPAEAQAACKKLRWNSVFNLNLGLGTNGSVGRHWVYFPDTDLSFFRVGFYHTFSRNLAPEDTTSLYAEVSYSNEHPLDRANIIKRIKANLGTIGIPVQNTNICAQDTNDIVYGYPLYDWNYRESRDVIVRFLRSHDIYPCGRYGAWRYFSMEDAMLDGKHVAESM